jgi:hypothetical protein
MQDVSSLMRARGITPNVQAIKLVNGAELLEAVSKSFVKGRKLRAEQTLPRAAVVDQAGGALRHALEAGSRFAIREGGRTVGAGVVASIIE